MCVLCNYGGDLVLDIVVPPYCFFLVFIKLFGSRTATTGHESLAPGIPTPLRSLGATAHGGLIPLQRSACDYAEVSAFVPVVASLRVQP